MEEIKSIEGILKGKEERKSAKGDPFWKLTVLDAGKEYKFFHWVEKFEIPIGESIHVSYIDKPLPAGGMIKETKNVTLRIEKAESKEERGQKVRERMEQKVDSMTKEPFKNGNDITELDNVVDEEGKILGKCYDAVLNIIGGDMRSKEELGLVGILYKEVKNSIPGGK